MNTGLKILLVVLLTVIISTETNGVKIEKVHRIGKLSLFGYGNFILLVGQDAVIKSQYRITIICEVISAPGERVTIEWRFNGESIIFNGFISSNYPAVVRYTEDELLIPNITSLQSGKYECILRNATTGEEYDRGESNLEVIRKCRQKCQGAKGKKGYAGERGDEGIDGYPGITGNCEPEDCKRKIGPRGRKGSTGIKGDNGVLGEKGSIGEKGDEGVKGSNGNNEERGVDGDRGEKGEIGEKGEGGQKGVNGTVGVEGLKGSVGEKGVNGERGEVGNTTVGPKGTQGEKGEIGEKGSSGMNGTAGRKGGKGGPGERGNKGTQGERGLKGQKGQKGIIGQRVGISAINSTYNTNCTQYEQGQIIYDTVISKFVFCDGTNFQIIKDRPCVGECKEEDPPINSILQDVDTNCVSLIFIIDESASMREEQIWLQNVSSAITGALAQRNDDSGICNNNFAILGFGTGEEKSRAEQIGRPVDLGGVTVQEGTTVITVPYWGTTQDVIRVVNANPFQGQGRREDGYAAVYRALQRYTFIGQACRKMLLITDEDRDNETPSPDPVYDRVPTLFNQNMRQILQQFSITLSAVINIQFQAQGNQQPLINADTILGLMPNNYVIYYDPNATNKFNVASGGYVRKDSAAGNTEQTYFQMVRASGGIAWSLPVSRSYRDAFTNAFLKFEIIPHVTQNNNTGGSGCKLDTCQRCICEDGKYDCKQIQAIDFNTTIQCRPTECNTTQLISGFRQPSCVDMIFTVAETSTMQEAHGAIKDVAIRLPTNLAAINFGQENSLCPNTYCLMGFGAENRRNGDSCYSYPFPIPPNQKLCAPSSQLAPLIVGIDLTATGQEADGYSSIYTALQTYKDNFQTQSCRHITLITDSDRYDCGSYTTGNTTVPQLDRELIQTQLQTANIILNVIVNATFQDQNGNKAIGIFKETEGYTVAVVPSSTTDLGYVLVPGGAVTQAYQQVEQDYIDLALALNGSAWDINQMGEQTDLFTRTFVKAVVIKSSESCGQTRACVECKCVGGELQPCAESTRCVVLPKLDKTYTGTVTGTEAQFGQTLVAITEGELRITGSVMEGSMPLVFEWVLNGEVLMEGQDYSFEYEGNTATIIVHNFQSQHAGTYSVIVSNIQGSDTYTFELIVATTISCNNTGSNSVTTCSSCSYLAPTQQAKLEFFMHSGRTSRNLTWYRMTSGDPSVRNIYTSEQLLIGPNSIALNYEEFCSYSYEVEVPYYGTIKFNCPINSCSIYGKEVNSCSNDTVVFPSCDANTEGVDVMLVLDVTTEMKPVNEFILETLLPTLESQLTANCIGKNSNSRNEYTATIMSINDQEPTYIRQDHFIFSSDNTNNLEELQNDINDIANDKGGRGAYGAVKLALNNERVRPNNKRILIISTDKRRDSSIYHLSELERKSYGRQDSGRSLFTEALKDINPNRVGDKRNPIFLVNTKLSSITKQNDTINCMGASNLLQCYHNESGIITRTRGKIINSVEANSDRDSIHQDFVVPGLDAGGFVWDINAILNGGAEERIAISNSIVESVIPRVREGECQNCRCLYGNRLCESLSLSPRDEELCQCEQVNGAGNCECLNVDLPGDGSNADCQLIKRD